MSACGWPDVTLSRLLLDVGNSRLKWALDGDDGLRVGEAVAHHGDPAAAVAAMHWPQQPGAVLVADVTGGALRAALGQALRKRCGVEPQFAVAEASRDGLTSAYAEPRRLGVDRWLMLLAAWTQTRAAVCVVSAGTALTFDTVDARGQHLGGVIAPGLHAMQTATLGATRFAAGDPAHRYDGGLGGDTEHCVRQGALHAAAGLIDRLARRYGRGAQCFIAGGDAALLLPHLDGTWSLHADLVLEGLRALASPDGAA